MNGTVCRLHKILRSSPNDFRKLSKPKNFRYLSSLQTVVDDSHSVNVPHLNPIENLSNNGKSLKPDEVVRELDKYIVGQSMAKRAVAIAMRNRWRRHRLSDELKSEVIPKNILMIGPTGCGKTEVARRIAKMTKSPFIKVEATKFTEVGFHGKDVDQIIKDLVEISINMHKKAKKEKCKNGARIITENKILELLTGTTKGRSAEHFKNQLREGLLDEYKIKVNVPVEKPSNPMDQVADLVMKGIPRSKNKKTEQKILPISEAFPILEDVALEEMVNSGDVVKEAIASVEQDGIVFIDEIDKICSANEYKGSEASAEGVQRDLLPLIEGSTIQTKYGNVNTDFILFIGSGAFSQSKPSDLLAELQGRLPIRVELQGLTEDDLYRILTEPVSNLIQQQIALLQTENITIEFEEKSVRRMAQVAAKINRTAENIGARRLHTIIEKVIEEISFNASDEEPGTVIKITPELVEERVGSILKEVDLSKYIL
mmetsp:Transcript_7751/g.11696  ORF Transcript_7751/g.11696 Transcript_7751/m.11696 type:complete len:485 (+) Transcript_7751:64-1518(+)